MVNALALDPAAPGSGFTVQPPETVSRLFGDFEVQRLIGHGGMGAVYQAWQRSLARSVALKLLPAELLRSEDFFDRFQREARVMAQFDHPNLARIFETGITEGGQAYIVMEYIAGQPMITYAAAHPLSRRQRLELFLQVCAGVQHAHQKGMIHRDLKPSNVLITGSDSHAIAKVIDFGLAKPATETDADPATWFSAEAALGTPAYMSPEQAAGADIDTRSDIYSLGAILYELVTGRTPWIDVSWRELTRSRAAETIHSTPIPKPSVSAVRETDSRTHRAEPAGLRPLPGAELRGDLDAIVLRAMEKEPSARYPTVDALAEDVQRHLDDRTISIQTGLVLPQRLGKFYRRHRLGLGLAVFIGLLLLSGLALVMRESFRARRAERLADARLQQGEQLIDFMLGDLHGKLHVLGRLDILEGAISKVESFYGESGVAERSPANLRRHGRTKLLLGRIRNAQGDMPTAEKHVLESIRLYEAALRGRGELLPTAEQLAQCWNSLAVFRHTKNQYATAEPAYREAIRLMEEVLAAEPENNVWASSAAGIYHNFAAWCEATDRLSDAETNYTRALRLWQPILDQQPDNATLLEDLSHFYLNLALLQGRLGRAEDADRSNAEALRMRQRLVAIDPNNWGWQSLLADIKYNLGEVELARGNLPGAQKWIDEYRPTRERLASYDPANVGWQYRLTQAWHSYARLQARLGHDEQAAAAHRRAWESWEKHLSQQTDRSGEHSSWRADLQRALEVFTRLANRERDQRHEEAAADHLKTIAWLQEKLASDGPKSSAPNPPQ
jgi:serine/threonine protein kinase/tetratricopeptide (TPR) repeat protein